MKVLIKRRKDLQTAGRWDIDFHLPAEGIRKFPRELLRRVDEVADIAKDKRDPRKKTDVVFQYIDISAIDVAIGTIVNPQEVESSEAPSRARKVVSAFDVVVSTCRPTRGAIAVVPVKLHNQIASTAFSIVRPHKNVNPFYLHYALRLPSTLEQFRKWSTGSSYPAILDADVGKTIIPVPDAEKQDAIAAKVVVALRKRAKTMAKANDVWTKTLGEITSSLCGEEPESMVLVEEEEMDAFSLTEIQDKLKELFPIVSDRKVNGDGYLQEDFWNTDG